MRTTALPISKVTAALGLHAPLAHRVDRPELLDRPNVEPVVLEANLRDLARLNRLPGGVSTSIAGIRALSRGADAISVLDVGAGGGDVARAIARGAPRHGAAWVVAALDNRRDVVARASVTTGGNVTVMLGDATQLPLDDASVDVAHSSLLLHHLDPAAALAALREMRRVARVGVVVNDLRRGVVPFVATGVAVAFVGRCRATRADGLTSVRRAYTLAELDQLLDAAGLQVAWRSSRWMPRVVTAAVPRAET